MSNNKSKSEGVGICTTGGSEESYLRMMEGVCPECLGDCMHGCGACDGTGWKRPKNPQSIAESVRRYCEETKKDEKESK